MKILPCHNYYLHPGGEDSAYLAESELLTHFGHQVLGYVRRNEEIRDGGFLSKMNLQTTWGDHSISEIRDLLHPEKLDIVHFHNTFPKRQQSFLKFILRAPISLASHLLVRGIFSKDWATSS